MQKYIASGVLVIAVAVGGALIQTRLSMQSNMATTVVSETGIGVGHHVTLYRSPTCGCCLGYANALREEGFTVDVISDRNMREVKAQFAIPPDQESCHTSVVDGSYVIEGHVPLVAVERLMRERPGIAGIGLAFMPSGTPGMPGPKMAPYDVYKLTQDGEVAPYMSI